MPDFDSSRLRFWESAENLREHLSKIFNRQISANLATQISNHLAQGRLYFESASSSPYEIRPVLIFYGMVGFAKALILARNLSNTSTLPHKHGLRDVSDNNARLGKLKLKAEGDGTFQLFNDEARIKKVRLMEYSLWKDYYCFSSPSETINNKIFTLQEILSRIPGLELSYKDTFGTDPKVVQCSWPGYDQYKECIEFETFNCKPFRTVQEINIIANKIMEKYPFLKKWVLIEANWPMNNHSLKWANIKFDVETWISEENFSNDRIRGNVKNGFIAKDMIFDEKRIVFDEIIPPMEGGLHQMQRAPYIIEDFEGLDISEASLYYLGMFLLSSLVRYRPDTWIHSLKGRNTDTQPLDDKALAIILSFLDLSFKNFPDMILNFIKEPPHSITTPQKPTPQT